MSILGMSLSALALGISLASPSPAAQAQTQRPGSSFPTPASQAPAQAAPAQPVPQTPPAGTANAPSTSQADQSTYDQESVLQAASGALGRGAEEVGKVIEKIFADHGRPNAYIVGQEGGGAFIVGVRYGNGTLYHKVEGERPVHWTGPSVGADFGGDVNKTFTLIYNLHDSEELYRRYPAIEGKVYFIGGFTVNYHQRDNVMVVPIRLGAGWRLGANIGYINYTKDRNYLPF